MLVKQEKKKSKAPLTPWELPKLLEPMHRWRRPKKRITARWREHFLPILAFVYRNRFALACQIQRRFPKALPSARTARRHLTELEATSCLGVADTRSTSPLFPKVYFVTGRGVRKIEESLRQRGKPGRCCRQDRRRPEFYSPDHVLHEVLTTEFVLGVWQMAEGGNGTKLVDVQRRALERHTAFEVHTTRGRKRLKPDAMFVLREQGGLMCCFLELDNGTMNPRQMGAKFDLYELWARSDRGEKYLIDLYRRHGASRPRVAYRLLVVARHRSPGKDELRLTSLFRIARGLSPLCRRHLWITTIERLQKDGIGIGLQSAIWYRYKGR